MSITNKSKPAKIISDLPIDNKTKFGFEAYAKTFADLIANNKNKTPLTMGIYGPWGSGKTTLMKSIVGKLKNYNNDEQFRICKPVWFVAWKHGCQDEILASLIETIFKTMEADGFFSQSKSEILKLTQKLDKKKIIGAFSKALTAGSFDVTEFFMDLPHKDKLGFLTTFQELFATLIKWYTQDGILVIFIDDLDRCSMEHIPKVLETTKLFMDKKDCAFVIGADKSMIEKALNIKYPGEAKRFLEKIVQVNFDLPRIRNDEISGYIDEFLTESNLLKEHMPAMAANLNNNPRRIKRFLNNFSLMRAVIENKLGAGSMESDDLVRWLILDYTYPEITNSIRQNPTNLKTLKTDIAKIEKALKDKALWLLTDEVMKAANVGQASKKYLENKQAVELIKAISSEPQVIDMITTLSEAIVQADEKPEPSPSKRAGADEFDKFVTVPAGGFLYGEWSDQEEKTDSYEIGVYPVTNKQFAEFIKAGGYDNKDYWPAGWEWRQKNNINKPQRWRDEKWNKPDYPVVGVSWHETVAYANWKSGAEGITEEAKKYRLPSEAEWVKAARGGLEIPDGSGGLVNNPEPKRNYPWGDGFDENKCNTYESGIGGTTPVNKYLNGYSPYGCYDMAGNVWEWCADWYDKNKKVIRGGSWFSDADVARVTFRGRGDPVFRDFDIGFRLTKTL